MARVFRGHGFPLGALVLASVCAGGEAQAARRPDRVQPEVRQAVQHDLSPPLFLLPPAPPPPPRPDYEPKRLPRPPRPARPPVDRALQTQLPLTLAPVGLLNLEGVGNNFSGPQGTFFVGAAPPDTNGDVGPNHYVQLVNTDFAIFNKVGTPIYGPVPLYTLWSGFGGDCEVTNDGDPIVVYDPIADRWLISQFSVTNANGTSRPFLQCVAVSQTPDPTGAYYRYAFPYSGFNDYPKFGVWPDAYYASFNMFNAAGTSFQGGKVCAYDRARMLLGLSATQQCFNTSILYGGLLPADLDGARLPPVGAPNPVVSLGFLSSQLAVFKFHTDWANPANSTFTGPTNLATAAFSEACGLSGTCIPQLGGGALDSLGDRLMYRLAYRNFADGHQSLVVNHSITAGSRTGVRWYELRLDAGGTPSLFQQGTYAPDNHYRWMGSIAQDKDGNMGLGFSVSSSTIRPQIHYTGRLAGDPLGQMTQGEGIVIDGAGAQGSSLSRWGDYSMMAVDPSDDCTFWYTSEYIPANGTFNWRTRISSFRFPECGSLPDLEITQVSGPASAGPGSVITVSNTVKNTSGGSSGSFRVGLYLSDDSACTTGDAFMASRLVGPLAPGGASAASTTVTIPAGTALGTRYVCAIADDLSQVAESSEANNASSAAVSILSATPVITLKINGQHPTPPTVTVAGPTLLTLDVSPTAYTASVDWYWGLYYNGTLYWVTSAGLATTPAPWFTSPPVAVTNVTLLNVTLPPASTMTNLIVMVNGTTTVSFDYITATRP